MGCTEKIDNHFKLQEGFQLTGETLFLAVEMMDYYLMKINIKKDEFQLLGITTLFLSSKFYVSHLLQKHEFHKRKYFTSE